MTDWRGPAVKGKTVASSVGPDKVIEVVGLGQGRRGRRGGFRGAGGLLRTPGGAELSLPYGM